MQAVDMFAIVLRMTESWLSAPSALQAVAGQDPLSRARLRQHRKALVEAVRRLTEPASTAMRPSAPPESWSAASSV
jgi:hypothetical protein